MVWFLLCPSHVHRRGRRHRGERTGLALKVGPVSLREGYLPCNALSSNACICFRTSSSAACGVICIL